MNARRPGLRGPSAICYAAGRGARDRAGRRRTRLCDRRVPLPCQHIWFLIGLGDDQPAGKPSARAGAGCAGSIATGLRTICLRWREPSARPFAARRLRRGRRADRVHRPPFPRRPDPLSPMRGRGDRFVQVTPDHYMGPSGRIDDLPPLKLRPQCRPAALHRCGRVPWWRCGRFSRARRSPGTIRRRSGIELRHDLPVLRA